MWRHIPGVKEPEKRKKPDDQKEQEEGEVGELSGATANVKARTFKERWRVDDAGKQVRTWLKYENNKMSCTICAKYVKDAQKKTNPFITGTKNMKLETIKDHECSRCHANSIRASQPVTSTPVVKSATAMTDCTKEKMNNMFRTVPWGRRGGRCPTLPGNASK